MKFVSTTPSEVKRPTNEPELLAYMIFRSSCNTNALGVPGDKLGQKVGSKVPSLLSLAILV